MFLVFMIFFLFKQKTAYEMRISDWSSDVCSSDLGNGSRLGLVIQNPLAVKLKDCSLAVAWSSTDKSGNVIDSTRHAKEFDLDGAFPAGDYAFPSIDLADLKPSEIGLLTFSGFSCKRTATATP